ncbi:uncharacterized protein ASCRUDRAFT_10613 [Ascoidea rubescens DSM 1968]|uniref:Uncharacterized protein n=1 Tax=Ascoidea rubescens DSM 1968 TaxID=1344418 RepID=A0A1D2V913_9ASCO|nr:hypothetical protein ASCRUDRAFT_10613 [Ascoidea rubescens DSM 1968]ODV58007.1 hypothetical protein ASCRUDRAFT_10613 [Ascoidea rubescens DSM 1968]
MLNDPRSCEFFRLSCFESINSLDDTGIAPIDSTLRIHTITGPPCHYNQILNLSKTARRYYRSSQISS